MPSQMQEELETDQLEQQKRLENQARQSKELEKMALKIDGGAVLSPLPVSEDVLNKSRGKNESMIEMMNVPQPMADEPTPTLSTEASSQRRHQRKLSFNPFLASGREPTAVTI